MGDIFGFVGDVACAGGFRALSLGFRLQGMGLRVRALRLVEDVVCVGEVGLEGATHLRRRYL